MKLNITRCPENPIVWPGKFWWRKSGVFNPGVIYDEGKFYMYERAAESLRPYHCYIGLLESEDGIHFKHVRDEPVFTPEMAGSKYGTCQDARIAKIDGIYYMAFAFRKYAWSSHPTGYGVPESHQTEYDGYLPNDKNNQTISGIARSKDRINWEMVGWVNKPEIDDRDVILFPEKINGKFCVLRRPQGYVGTNTEHSEEHPGIYISYSDDLKEWTEPKVVIRPDLEWENNRIGGATQPIKTEHGWLTFYHGVETKDEKTRHVCYRLSAMMLDLNDPTKVIARCPKYIMEPEEYYEKYGLFIPDVIFPTGAVVKDDLVYIYYGVCDTAIALATIPFKELTDYVMQFK